jgi:hypothetical protein
MNSNDITTDQAKVINESVRQMLGYLARLKERMEKTGFPPNDRLYQIVEKAYDATQHPPLS